MRGARPHDLDKSAPPDDTQLEQRDLEPRERKLDPFDLNDYYQDAFCSLLNGGMGTCCG